MADEQDAKALLAEHLFTRPKARPVMEDLIAQELGDKAADAIPGYRARKEVDKRLAELDAKIAAFDQREAAATARREFDAEWSRVVSAGLVSDEDRAEVEKIMAERKTANYEDAAERLAAQRRAAIAPPRSDARTMQVPGVKGAGGDWFKGIIENPEEWGRNAAEQVIEDIKRGHLSKHL